MRPLVLLVCLLAALAAPAFASESDLDVERLQLELSKRVEQQIDRALRDALDTTLRASVHAAPAAPPAWVDSGAAPALVASAAAKPPRSEAPPARMRCRASSDYALECTVVSRRPGVERLAQAR